MPFDNNPGNPYVLVIAKICGTKVIKTAATAYTVHRIAFALALFRLPGTELRIKTMLDSISTEWIDDSPRIREIIS